MAGEPEITLLYEGTDISKDVDILECVHKDVSCGACDLLNLKVDHADKWMSWDPQKNDIIRVMRSGYDSMNLYLNTVIPEDGAYRILATGAKAMPFPARWQSFKDKTYGAIMTMCASECGMIAKNHGAGNPKYAYVLRENISAPVFMEMLANREGAVLKALDGSFTSIGVLYAQDLSPTQEVQLDSDQMSSTYIDRRDLSWQSVEINTPFGKGKARDSASSGLKQIITDIPVDDNAQARRWASGLLLMHNRQSEILEIAMDFNPGYTAMVRIDAKSATAANGQWIIHETEQDLLNGRTKAKLYRCITTIT